MSENKALWRRAFVTDPRAVKAITGKQYNGNSPKPYWIVERLTDEFGPCGLGWGFTILGERFERFSDTDSLHIAVVRLWYVMDGKRGELEQIGQTKASYQSAAGKFILDEDAPKKSVTDALVKCASYLGFAGDIFSGRWDDSKYVREAGRFWQEREQGGEPAALDTKAVLQEMKDAAENGLEVLQAVYTRLNRGEDFAALWLKEGKALRVRAKQVDATQAGPKAGATEGIKQ